MRFIEMANVELIHTMIRLCLCGIRVQSMYKYMQTVIMSTLRIRAFSAHHYNENVENGFVMLIQSNDSSSSSNRYVVTTKCEDNLKSNEVHLCEFAIKSKFELMLKVILSV